jgi:hypothetical protein
MLKKQNGRYTNVGTPSTAAMNAPHEFHGTSGEVTVPLSAASRDRFVGARPLLANSAR